MLRLQSGTYSSFDGALSARARPTCGPLPDSHRKREKLRTRTTIRSFTLPCRFSPSKEGGPGERVTRRQYRVASATDCRDFGTSITCRDKATCRETIETQGRSTYNATARSFSEDSTRRIASRGFNPFGTCDDCSVKCSL